MAVLGRNQILFRCVFRSHYRIRSTLTQYFRYGWGSYALCKFMNTWHVYRVRMSPTLNRNSVLQRFERGNAIEVRNGIMFNFYPGLPHLRANALQLHCFSMMLWGMRDCYYWWIFSMLVWEYKPHLFFCMWASPYHLINLLCKLEKVDMLQKWAHISHYIVLLSHYIGRSKRTTRLYSLLANECSTLWNW